MHIFTIMLCIFILCLCKMFYVLGDIAPGNYETRIIRLILLIMFFIHFDAG